MKCDKCGKEIGQFCFTIPNYEDLTLMMVCEKCYKKYEKQKQNKKQK